MTNATTKKTRDNNPRTNPATAPCDIFPEPTSVSSKVVETVVDVAVACDDVVVLLSTATPSAKPSYGYAYA